LGMEHLQRLDVNVAVSNQVPVRPSDLNRRSVYQETRRSGTSSQESADMFDGNSSSSLGRFKCRARGTFKGRSNFRAPCQGHRTPESFEKTLPLDSPEATLLPWQYKNWRAHDRICAELPRRQGRRVMEWTTMQNRLASVRPDCDLLSAITRTIRVLTRQ
jgi:hypothetical protein